jgi:hypothetical protein
MSSPEASNNRRIIILLLSVGSIAAITVIFTYMLLSPHQGVTTSLPGSGETKVKILPLPTPVSESPPKDLAKENLIPPKEIKKSPSENSKSTIKRQSESIRGEKKQRKRVLESPNVDSSELQEKSPYLGEPRPRVVRERDLVPEPIPEIRQRQQPIRVWVPGPTLKRLIPENSIEETLPEVIQETERTKPRPQPIPEPEFIPKLAPVPMLREPIPAPQEKTERGYEKIPKNEQEMVPRIAPIEGTDPKTSSEFLNNNRRQDEENR